MRIRKYKTYLTFTIALSLAVNSLFSLVPSTDRDAKATPVVMTDICDFSDIIEEMTDEEYRTQADVSEESFVVVRKEGIKDDSMTNFSDCEVVSEIRNPDGSRTVTYSVKADADSDIWNEIDDWNSSGDCLIAEPVYEYHICDNAQVQDESPDVEWAEVQFDEQDDITSETTLSDPNISEQWYLDEQGLISFWNKNGIEKYSGKGSVVAVIDTGVDYTHADLKDNIWVNKAEASGLPGVDDDGNGYVDDINGVSVVYGDDSLMDENGHGTFVAGVIGMENNENGGVGISCNSRIMIVKAGDAAGTFKSTDIAKAIDYASEMGADVINMSFGSYVHSAIVEMALQRAFGTSVLVAAAGNDGYTTADSDNANKGNQYPACYSYVIGVMAYDKTGKLSSFSNWDANAGRGPEYEIAAPGVSIYSTLTGGAYGIKNGTSYAAPIVSAAVSIYIAEMKGDYSSRSIMDQLIGNIQADENGIRRFSSGAFLASLVEGDNSQDSIEISAEESPDSMDASEEASVAADGSGSEDEYIGGSEEISVAADNSASGNDCMKNDASEEASVAADEAGEADVRDVDLSESVSITTLSGNISEDTTLDGNYIINGALVIDEGVTVTVAQGSRLEFWTGDPSTVNKADPYTFIKVNGSFICEGSYDSPINLLPGRSFTPYRVEIINNGTVNMSYVNIINPYISINNGDHLNLCQDFDTVNYRGMDEKGKYHVYKGSSRVVCDNISYSNMTNLRNNSGTENGAHIEGCFDTVQFDNCSFDASSIETQNSVFLINCARVESPDSGELEYIPTHADADKLFSEQANGVILNNAFSGVEEAANALISENCYPVVSDIYIEDAANERTAELDRGKYTLHIIFNRDMDDDAFPEVSYDIEDPYTDHVVNGLYVSSKEWVGNINIDEVIGEGCFFVRVKGACALDDKWLVTGTDWGRYSFEVKFAGEASAENPGENSGENAGEDPDETPGEDPGENAGENPNENLGENAGENAGEKAGENSGETAGENAGEDPDENQGENAGEDPDEDPGENAGEDSDENQGENSNENPGEKVSDPPGENVNENVGAKVSKNPGENSNENAGANMSETSGEKASEPLGENLSDSRQNDNKNNNSANIGGVDNKNIAFASADAQMTSLDDASSDAQTTSLDDVSSVAEPTVSNNPEIMQIKNFNMKQNALKLKWKKVSNADGYYVYAGYYGSKLKKPVKIINKKNARSISITKLNGKKLNQTGIFISKVEAYKLVDGKETIIAQSDIYFLVGKNNKKYTNVKAITLSQKEYKIKIGMTSKIKAKIALADEKKTMLPSSVCPALSYRSSDTGIATVDKKGRVTGVSAGTCTIYVYARNGYAKKIKVTVK